MEKVERVFELFNKNNLTINDIIQINLNNYDGPIDVLVDVKNNQITVVYGLENISKFIYFLNDTKEPVLSKSRYINNYFILLKDTVTYKKIHPYCYLKDCDETERTFLDKVVDDLLFILDRKLKKQPGKYLTAIESDEYVRVVYDNLHSYLYEKSATLDSFKLPLELSQNKYNVQLDALYLPTTSINNIKQLFLFLVDKESNKVLEQAILNDITDRDIELCKFYANAIIKFGVFNFVELRNNYDRNLLKKVNDFLDIKVTASQQLTNIDSIVKLIMKAVGNAHDKK